MAVLVTDPRLEERLIEQRRATGADHHDEVWEGIYMMAPFPTSEHQDIAAELVAILREVIDRPGLGKAFGGVNLAGEQEDWRDDYRVPDVVVFLHGGPGRDCDSHWRGGADLVVEISSPGDRTYAKLPFYGQVGVREVLVVDRDPWSLHLYQNHDGQMDLTAEAAPGASDTLSSSTVPFQFRLLPGEPRPSIEVVHAETGRRWNV